jgi:hypothetical protein
MRTKELVLHVLGFRTLTFNRPQIKNIQRKNVHLYSAQVVLLVRVPFTTQGNNSLHNDIVLGIRSHPEMTEKIGKEGCM